MITPDEIARIAHKWWKPFLISTLEGSVFFPKQIDRIGKIQAHDLTHRFMGVIVEVEELYKHSKNQTGIGYTVKTLGRRFRRTGEHELPDTVEIETVQDFLHVIGKLEEWRLFQENLHLILKELPQLKKWVVSSPVSLTSSNIQWTNILKVCQYFILTPRPNLYLRELPIPVHTKFIEDNEALIKSLLDFLIPNHIRNIQERKFSERYFLNHDEPLVRIRILDEKLAIADLRDVTIRLSDFEKMPCDCKTVFITENKMNFLTFPDFSSAIAIWSGGGFMVSYFENAFWLKTKTIFYWGDIDEHGFQILHQVRGKYKQVKSLMMDLQTFSAFEDFAEDGKRSNVSNLELLDKEEAFLYSMLKVKTNKNRLEQEKISQSYIKSELKKIAHQISCDSTSS